MPIGQGAALEKLGAKGGLVLSPRIKSSHPAPSPDLPITAIVPSSPLVMVSRALFPPSPLPGSDMPAFNPNRSKPWYRRLGKRVLRVACTALDRPSPTFCPPALPAPASPSAVTAVRVGNAPPSSLGKTLRTSQNSLEAKLGPLLSAPHLLRVEPGLDSWGLGEPWGHRGRDPAPLHSGGGPSWKTQQNCARKSLVAPS